MKYRSFVTLAAVLAVMSMAGSPLSSAVARTEATSASTTVVMPVKAKSTELYAQASNFGEPHPVRLDAQLTSTGSKAEVSGNSAHDAMGFDLMALVLAGLAVMGSLAFRRSPNK
jgi:hypothetical protein